MKNFFSRIADGLRRFSYGRYGMDELSFFLSIATLVLIVLSFFPHLGFLSIPAILIAAWSTFRMLSKNIYRRRAERDIYMKIRKAVLGKIDLWKCRWRDRKTHRYYTCPHCKAVTRITNPGRGRRITIHCPKCGQSFDKKT